MPFRPAFLALFILFVFSVSAFADDDVRKGVFYTKMHGQEVSREEFEIRDDGWWAKGKLDLFGQQKSEYEITEKRVSPDKTVIDGKFLQDGKPVELLGTLTPKSYDLAAKVGGKDETLSVPLEGKGGVGKVVPQINLVWIFMYDLGRELVALADAGSLVADAKLDLIDVGNGRMFDARVNSHRTTPGALGQETVPLYVFEVTLAGSVNARLVTTKTGVPVYFGVPAQKLETFIEGYESLVPAASPPSTIVDSGPWRDKLSKPEHAVIREKNVKIAMRDGVKLAADVIRPELPAGKKVPTVLARTPYGRESEAILKGNYFAQRGYAVVAQDVRGRFDSEGEFRPVFNEANDGSDTLDWIAAQPWSDGNVGMIGASYVGWVQWLAAMTGNPHLKAIVPQVAPPDPHENIPYDGGVFCLSTAWWAVAADAIANKRSFTDRDKKWWNEAMGTLPISDLDTALDVASSTFLDEWIAHPPEDPYWEPIRYQQRFASIDVPSLNISGWYDGDQPGAPLNFIGMRRHGKSERARNGTMLVMGPWPHAFNMSTNIGEFEFGKEAVVDLDALALRFFDHHLKGVDNGTDKEDPVLIFTMFENAWHREKDWPLPQTNWTKLYLGGSGKANKRDGGGTLGLAPADGPPDRYAYDPHGPRPEVDFNDLSGRNATEDAYLHGDEDFVLDYFSPPLAEAVEVTGPISVTLSVTTDAVDTDFAAVLLRVDAAGKTTFIRAGIQRLKYRNGWNKPSLAKPGEVSTVTIDCWATGIRFEKGERIALMIGSDLFPGYARHLNTGEPDTIGKKGVVANQTVFHDVARPSFVTLPVIPRGESKAIRFEAEEKKPAPAER